METVSEKKRRGRPPAFSEGAYELVRGRTRRSQQDVLYRVKAMSAIEGICEVDPDSPLRALHDHERFVAGEPGATKPLILSELGRAMGRMHPADWDALAHRAAKTTVATKDVVRQIRYARRFGLSALDARINAVHARRREATDWSP